MADVNININARNNAKAAIQSLTADFYHSEEQGKKIRKKIKRSGARNKRDLEKRLDEIEEKSPAVSSNGFG